MKRLVADSPLVQYQLLFHRRPAVTDKSVLIVGGADDLLVRIATQLSTARRYEAEVQGDRALEEIIRWSEQLPT